MIQVKDQNPVKKMKIYLKFLVTNEHTKLNCSFLKSSFWKVWRI